VGSISLSGCAEGGNMPLPGIELLFFRKWAVAKVLFFHYKKFSTCLHRKGAEIPLLDLPFLSVFLSACNTSKAADWSFTKLYLKTFPNIVRK
jgi:hypothetical protein